MGWQNHHDHRLHDPGPGPALDDGADHAESQVAWSPLDEAGPDPESTGGWLDDGTVGDVENVDDLPSDWPDHRTGTDWFGSDDGGPSDGHPDEGGPDASDPGEGGDDDADDVSKVRHPLTGAAFVPIVIAGRVPPTLDPERARRGRRGLAGSRRALPARPDAFVSYVREEHVRVGRLVADLRSAGLDVWQDVGRITPGQRWKGAVRRAILQSEVFLACFSTTFLQRERSEMWAEVRLAIDELTRRPDDRSWFIPVLLDACEVPELPIGANEHLCDLEAVHLHRDWDRGVADIVEVVTGEPRP